MHIGDGPGFIRDLGAGLEKIQETGRSVASKIENAFSKIELPSSDKVQNELDNAVIISKHVAKELGLKKVADKVGEKAEGLKEKIRQSKEANTIEIGYGKILLNLGKLVGSTKMESKGEQIHDLAKSQRSVIERYERMKEKYIK